MSRATKQRPIEKNVLCGEEINTDIGMCLGEATLMCLQNHGSKLLQVDAENGKELYSSDLIKYSTKLAQWMTDHGLKCDTSIAIVCENRIEFTIIVVAAAFAGVTIAPVNPEYSNEELLHVFHQSKPKIIFARKASIFRIKSMLKDLPYVNSIVQIDGIKKQGKHPLLTTIMESKKYSSTDYFPPKVDVHKTMFAIMCSSGTTGLPKGVMLTQNNIIALLCIVKRVMEDRLSPDEIMISVTPLYHSLGLLLCYLNLINGNKTVLISDFEWQTFLRAIEDHGVTTLVVPPTITVMLYKSPITKNYDLSSVKYIRNCLAYLSYEFEIGIQKKYNLKEVTQAYGLTEVTLGVLLQPKSVKPGSVGTIVPGMKVKVVDEHGETLGPFETGELCFQGPLVMKGYANNLEATVKMIDSNAWLHSGDVGYYDNDGYFFIVDRIKELIKYKGHQVPPAELEAILMGHPKIMDAAVIGIPDEVAGELPLAFVVIKSGAKLSVKAVKEYVSGSAILYVYSCCPQK